MTKKNAIKILDIYIERNNKLANGLLDPTQPWNDSFDFIKRLVETLSDLTKDDTKVLELIKKQLQTNCKHPKKMRDKDPEGQWYCMDCNQDL